jgi:hypothetical protein
MGPVQPVADRAIVFVISHAYRCRISLTVKGNQGVAWCAVTLLVRDDSPRRGGRRDEEWCSRPAVSFADLLADRTQWGNGMRIDALLVSPPV